MTVSEIFWSRVSSEPAVFAYSFAIGLYGAVIPNLIQQKTCCPDFEPAFDYVCSKKSSLIEATDITTARSTLRELLPASVLLLAGSWRDTTGLTKPIMYSALVGEMVGVSVELFAVWKWDSLPWMTSLIEAILYGISGGSKLFYVGATCFITEKSVLQNRTARLAIYQASAIIGTCLATGVSGYCLNYLGYRWFFILIILLHLLAMSLVMVIPEEAKLMTSGKEGILPKMKAIFKARPNNKVIWLMLLICCLVNVCATAEENLYLYFLQQGLGFTVTGAGVYTAYRYMISVLSSVFLPPVFTKIMGWSDLKIGLIGSCCMVVTSTMMAFASNVLELITISLLDFMKIFVITIPVSIVTKCVNSDEVGMFVSLRFIGESMFPIVIFSVYNIIFNSTSQKMPGAFFLASAGVALLVLVFFSISYCIYVPPSDKLLESKKISGVDLEKVSQISRKSITNYQLTR